MNLHTDPLDPSDRSARAGTRRPCRPWRQLLAAAALATLGALAACGGGGGGGGDTDPGPGNPPPPPPPPTGVSGRLWHDNYALDFRDGTQIASPTGALPVQVTSEAAAYPWPDGTQYVTTEWDVYEDRSSLEVMDTATGQVRHALWADGYLRQERPSPVDKNMVVALLGEDSISPADWVFIDLDAAQVVHAVPGDTPLDWLPDGRYLRVLRSGEIRTGRLGGTEQVTGRLALPANHAVADLWVNRQGDRLALRLDKQVGTLVDADIWVADLDGSRLEPLTATTMSYYARWSPDGRHIAFDVDTGHFCTGFGCMGTCELWYVPATARRVTALPAAGDAYAFEVKNRDGDTRTLGCELLAWSD